MQPQTGPRVFAAPMPSFMSVFDEIANPESPERAASGHDLNSANGSLNAAHDICFSPISQHFSIFHQPRNSTSTAASDSSDSSPTTTVSTLDSSSITDSSAGTSPETPSSSTISPVSTTMDSSRFKLTERSQSDSIAAPFFELQRPATPAKKARNLKNLAVNTATATYSLGRAVPSAAIAAEQRPVERISAPASPAFVKPPTPPRRKFSNLGLTIMTPANSNIPRLAIPPTPSQARPNTLRHFQSSPSLPLYTPSAAPSGGMTLPNIHPRPATRGFADIPLDEEDEEPEPNFDVPQSQEEKPDSYPHGPIRIYESGIDLYYEPSVEVASRYDVILNVASEVKNPFVVAASQVMATDPMQSPTVGLLDSSQDSSSPDTPKATPITPHPSAPMPLQQPEYIHVPWEHNTDIVPDLLRLVKLIDDRVMDGKRVLVHCQCGVSRSASLIVAYGLYKNPGMTVQEAYDAVKKRSKWIGPNMNLIMQLQEFRSSLLRNARREQLFTVPRNLASPISSASTDEHFDLGSVSTPETPRTAPLPPDSLSPVHSATGSIGSLSSGPIEPGQGAFWNPGFRRSWGHSPTSTMYNAISSDSVASETPYVNTKGHVVPMVTLVQKPQTPRSPNEDYLQQKPEQSQTAQDSKSLKRKTPNFSRQLPLRRDWAFDYGSNELARPTLMSPRSEEFHMVGLNKPNEPVDSGDVFGLLSPLKTEFSSNPFESLIFSQTTPERPQFAAIGSILDRRDASYSAPQNRFRESASKSLRTPPRNSILRTKFSSPTLGEQMRLWQIQTNLEATLPHGPSSPKRHQDDLDALMSPRATEFTSNPFHDLLSLGRQSQQQPQPVPPATPKNNKADPRSPAQHGISPITRNIFEVL